MRVPDILHRRITAVVFLAVSVGVTIWGSHLAAVDARENAESRFASEMGRMRRTLSRRMLEYQQVLRGAAGLFQAAGTIDRQTWKTYVAKLATEQSYPGMQGLGFSLRVPAAAKDRAEANARAEGSPDYRVWPAGNGPEFYPVTYLEPLSGQNLRALGYDMFSEPVRRAAMEKARDTGQPSLTGKVQLVQETDQDVQPGFLMYIPVYQRGAHPETIDERREALYGFAFIPFRARDLARGILGRGSSDIDLEVYDGGSASPAAFLFDDDETVRPSTTPHPGTAFSEVRTIEIAAHPWTLSFHSSPTFDRMASTMEPTLIAIAGLSIDTLLFFIFVVLSKQSASASEFARSTAIALHESRDELQAVAETANDAIVSSDSRGNIVHFNQAATLMFGSGAPEVVGRPCSILFPERFREGYLLGLQQLAAGGRPEAIGGTVELLGLRRDGTEFPFEISLASWSSARGVCFTGIIRDISKRKQQESALKESLAEKETLLKEVHHRVKNNLQIISSLFSLQSKSVSDPELLGLFQESQNRVKTMALIHERLYQSPELSRINFAEYSDDLARSLSRSFGLGPRVSVTIDVHDVYLGVDTAVPCGLILNELISNAFKHAFPNGRSGHVRVEFRPRDEKGFILIVSDDGAGLPEGLDLGKTDSLGFRLVRTLVEHQLQGSLSVSSNPGMTVRIELPGLDGPTDQEVCAGVETSTPAHNTEV